MSKPLSYLPVWKANATPAERLQELVLMAEKHPEWFQKFVIGYVEIDKEGDHKFGYHVYGMRTTEAIGVFEMAKNKLIEATSK